MNWNMYFFCLWSFKKTLSNLSKIAAMSPAISDILFSDFEQVFACKETSYVKVSDL